MRTLALLALALIVSTPARADSDPPESEPKDDKDKEKKDKKDKKVEVSGFITTQYEFRIEQNDDGVQDNDGFRIGKAVVRVKGRVSEYFGYVVEIDPRSPTLEGVMRDGYISVHVIPGHQIRLGQQKVPFGYENWLPSRQLYTHHRSELSEDARGFTHRDIGIGLVGKRKLADGLRLEDAVALVNGAGFGVQEDNTDLKNLWGRVGLRYKHRGTGLIVHVGVSGAIGDQYEPEDEGDPAYRFQFKRVGGDLEVDHEYGFFGVEYMNSWIEEPADSGDTERLGAFVLTLAGKTPWHAGPVFKYDQKDDEEFSRFTVGAYYGEPKADFRAHLGYEYWTDVVEDPVTMEDVTLKHDGRVVAQALVVF